jgi:hypothetical protein
MLDYTLDDGHRLASSRSSVNDDVSVEIESQTLARV